MIRRLFVIPALIAMLANVSPALAHALLDHASPAIGSTVHKPPSQLTLWFTEGVEQAFSSIQVFDINGRQINEHGLSASGADKRILTVPLPTLTPGKYKVVWRVISTDSHKTSGSYEFVVAP
jgi:methionine-rich copper-binding protein CopC